jgi:hypothetical protein
MDAVERIGNILFGQFQLTRKLPGALDYPNAAMAIMCEALASPISRRLCEFAQCSI